MLLVMVGMFLAQGVQTAQAKSPPRVLIIGDYISMGYTDSVKKMLAGKADVQPAYKASFGGLDNLLLSDSVLMFRDGVSQVEVVSLGRNQVDLAIYPHTRISGEPCSDAPSPDACFEPGTDIGFAWRTHAELREVRLTPEYRFALTVEE